MGSPESSSPWERAPGAAGGPRAGFQEWTHPLPLKSNCKAKRNGQKNVSYREDTTIPVLLPGERKWGMERERLSLSSITETTVVG